MEIQLISSLTAEDEARVAGALLAMMTSLLDHFAIAYSVRIETGGQVLQRANPGTPIAADTPLIAAPVATAPKPDLPS